ncbi:MAG: VOC family protein [Microvirga sp.]
MHRRIDHLVVAVRDLSKAAAFYRALGFQVGARNRHPWGTENHVVQMPGSFIELIAVADPAGVEPHQPGRFSFGAFIRDYLAHREGLAMLVLDSRDAAADARAFAADGIGAFSPFSFERRATTPDGREARVAFSLAFARDETAPLAGFFVCHHETPDTFWNPAFQHHPNGAAGLASVALAAPEPDGRVAFLRAFTGRDPESPDAHDYSFALDGSRLDLMTPDDAAELYGSVETELDQPGFVAFTISVGDLAAQAARLAAAGVPCQSIGARLIVPASVAFGVAIAFEAD